MTIQTPHLIKILNLAEQLLTIAQIPLYGSKRSCKTFTNHQLFKLYIVKEYEQKDYRGFEEYLKTSKILEHLKIKRVPHFTTLQKFAKRQNIQNLQKMLLKFIDLAPKKLTNIGADATCYRGHFASEHYEKRIERSIKKKDFLKMNFFYDLRNLLILVVKFRKKTRHDTVDLIPMWNQFEGIHFKRFYADKAYDAEWFHELIFASGAESRIHLKNEEVPVHRTKGWRRKHMKRCQLNRNKGKRSLCETINSVLKRLFGSVCRAKTWTMQKIELLFKIITYNLDRITKISKSFLQQFVFALLWSKFVAKSIIRIL